MVGVVFLSLTQRARRHREVAFGGGESTEGEATSNEQCAMSRRRGREVEDKHISFADLSSVDFVDFSHVSFADFSHVDFVDFSHARQSEQVPSALA